MIKYQVQSRFHKKEEWLDDHLPFDTRMEAVLYIGTQPKTFYYRIVEEEYEE